MALYSIAMNKTKRQQQKEKNKNGRMLMTGLIVGTMVLALVLATVTARSGGGGVQEAKAAGKEVGKQDAGSRIFDGMDCRVVTQCDAQPGGGSCTTTRVCSEPLAPLRMPLEKPPLEKPHSPPH